MGEAFEEFKWLRAATIDVREAIGVSLENST